MGTGPSAKAIQPPAAFDPPSGALYAWPAGLRKAKTREQVRARVRSLLARDYLQHNHAVLSLKFAQHVPPDMSVTELLGMSAGWPPA